MPLELLPSVRLLRIGLGGTLVITVDSANVDQRRDVTSPYTRNIKDLVREDVQNSPMYSYQNSSIDSSDSRRMHRRSRNSRKFFLSQRELPVHTINFQSMPPPVTTNLFVDGRLKPTARAGGFVGTVPATMTAATPPSAVLAITVWPAVMMKWPWWPELKKKKSAD